ncbi:MAG: hypothetical protein ACE5EH_12760 [Gammaproteobacteria bacterium]
MINLRLPLTPSRMLVSWPAHPWGGIYDISSSYAALDEDSQRTLASDFNIYKKIARKSPHVITREELVFLGALCWRLKNDLLKIYRKNNIDHKIIYYEQLIERPRKILEGVLPYIGAAWEDNVLKHHEIHAGQSIGGTSNTRPIDKNNRGKWKRRLGANDISIIKKLCGKPANKLFRNYFS